MQVDRSPSIRTWLFTVALTLMIAISVAMLRTDAGRRPTGGDADAEAIGVSRTLVWIDRQGHRSPLPVPPRGYVYPRLSPDGTRIAVDIRDRGHGIWMWNMAARTLNPLSTGRASDISPVWTRDGDWVVFARGRGVAPAILKIASDGSGRTETRPALTNSLLMPGSLSPDAAQLVVTASVASGFDLQVLSLAGPGDPQPLVATGFDELNGEVSPDGRWLAYQSRQSGQFEIWVQRFDGSPQFPAPSPEKLGVSPEPPVPSPQRVSSQGGTRPVWARNGRELFYLTVDNRMMAVPIASGERFEPGVPIELFTAPIYADLVGRTFDISPDGGRFLVVMELMRTQ
jgi:serine/threonine-protein kinase